MDKISAGYEIFAPVLHNGLPVFEHITETDKVLSDVYTVNSPKGVVFPQTEVLLKFNLAKNKVDLKRTRGI